jgi:hypothetical protein
MSVDNCAELDTSVFSNSVSAVVTRVEKLALGATNDPLISIDNCAELDTSVFSNSVSAVVTLVEKLPLSATKEPLTSVAICAELDTTLVPVKGNLICFDFKSAIFLFYFSYL